MLLVKHPAAGLVNAAARARDAAGIRMTRSGRGSLRRPGVEVHAWTADKVAGSTRLSAIFRLRHPRTRPGVREGFEEASPRR